MTKHGRPAVVVLAAEEYEWIKIFNPDDCIARQGDRPADRARFSRRRRTRRQESPSCPRLAKRDSEQSYAANDNDGNESNSGKTPKQVFYFRVHRILPVSPRQGL